MGYESSPSNFPVSPSLLAAAAVTMAGKKSITQSTSYTPFSEKWLPAPRNGTEKIAKRAMVHIQNVALCGSVFFKYLIAWVRCSSIPSVKGKSILSKPPKKFVVSSVQPTPLHQMAEAIYCDSGNKLYNLCHNKCLRIWQHRRRLDTRYNKFLWRLAQDALSFHTGNALIAYCISL